MSPDSTLVVADINADSRIDEPTQNMMKKQEIGATINIPLVVGTQWFGVVAGFSQQPIRFNEEAVRQIKGLTDQAAVVSQTLRLFEDAQERARREQLLREMTARIHAAPDAEAILRTAAKEVNRALGLEAFVYLEEPKVEGVGNGHDPSH
jgi:GAF domain-containing protein